MTRNEIPLTTPELIELRNTLTHLGTPRSFIKHPDAGICFNTRHLIPETSTYFLNDYLFSEWPHHSGDQLYPVPHAGPDPLTAEQAYDDPTLDMWEGPYGDLRKDLCRFTAERIYSILMEREDYDAATNTTVGADAGDPAS